MVLHRHHVPSGEWPGYRRRNPLGLDLPRGSQEERRQRLDANGDARESGLPMLVRKELKRMESARERSPGGG